MNEWINKYINLFKKKNFWNFYTTLLNTWYRTWTFLCVDWHPAWQGDEPGQAFWCFSHTEFLFMHIQANLYLLVAYKNELFYLSPQQRPWVVPSIAMPGGVKIFCEVPTGFGILTQGLWTLNTVSFPVTRFLPEWVELPSYWAPIMAGVYSIPWHFGFLHKNMCYLGRGLTCPSWISLMVNQCMQQIIIL